MEKTEDKREQVDRQLEQRKLENQKRLEANRIAELRRSKAPEVSKSEKERAYAKRQSEGTHLSANEVADKRKLRTREAFERAYSAKERRHVENYQEYRNLWESKKIEIDAPVLKNVKGRAIVSGELVRPDWNTNSKAFWEHHGHTRKEYQSHAEKYHQIQELLCQGKRIEEIKLDEELGASAKFWYNEHPMKLTQYKDSLITESGFHRATLAKMYDLNDVPAQVKEAHIKR